MRKQLVLFLFVAVTVFFSACKKDVGDIVVKGNWKISSFIEDGADQTVQFSGYYFEFGNNGNVTAFNGVSSQYGSWDESNGKFSISFPSGGAMTELNNTWRVESKSRTEIHLVDDDTGDRLVFKKL